MNEDLVIENLISLFTIASEKKRESVIDLIRCPQCLFSVSSNSILICNQTAERANTGESRRIQMSERRNEFEGRLKDSRRRRRSRRRKGGREKEGREPDEEKEIKRTEEEIHKNKVVKTRNSISADRGC